MFGQQAAYNLVVNGREVFNDVAMKDVAVAFNPGVGLVQGAVRAFADAAGVAGMDETRFPNGFDDPAEGVVDDPVAKGGGADQAALRFVDVEVGIRAGPVALLLEFPLQPPQVAFKIELKGGYGG